jgi:hypothetical protein
MPQLEPPLFTLESGGGALTTISSYEIATIGFLVLISLTKYDGSNCQTAS